MNYYTDEKNTLILISLLKAHGIKKIIISPGATNVRFVASVQNDKDFECYSCVDERSAAYMACGMAEESGEPVVLSCTGATASRNYYPAFTEAYYRKLPIIAVTSTQYLGLVGHHIPQVTDRSTLPYDVVLKSVAIPMTKDRLDEWSCNVKINDAILESKRHGGGPVHINLETDYSQNFDVRELPITRKIERLYCDEAFPVINAKRVAIYVGNHAKWSTNLTNIVDEFCEKYNGVVLCDHTSNYHGKYKINPSLICGQTDYSSDLVNMDLLIHIGNISGAYFSFNPVKVWRINPDGEIRDPFRKLEKVFEMSEECFFTKYVEQDTNKITNEYYEKWIDLQSSFLEKIPEIPFSNAWVANSLSKKLPSNSVIHFGILNSLRCWNFFKIDEKIDCYCNTGGFGIDGINSTAIGASLATKDKIHFVVIGDLAFFYDMNSIGNRHINSNLRILLINNGVGTEFKNFNHNAAILGDDADPYVAAMGHFGNCSRDLVKHYAEDMGFQYYSASSKDEFLEKTDCFVSKDSLDKPIIFEVFTSSIDESDALKKLYSIKKNVSTKKRIYKTARKILGKKGINAVKKIVRG